MRIAIIGAGHGGLAAAAHMAFLGHEVRIYNRSPERLAAVRATGRIPISGALGEHDVPIAAVADSLAEAVAGTELVMFAVPTTAHEHYARALAPHLPAGAVIMLNPGHTGGALHVAHWLRQAGARPGWAIGETNTLTYICRVQADGRVGIHKIGEQVLFSAFPGRELERVKATVLAVYPRLKPVPSVLHTSLSNLNAVLHPPGMLLNAGWIQHTGGDFFYYYEGHPQAVADTIAAVDAERLALAKALGVAVPSFLEALYIAGYTSEAGYRSGDIHVAMRESVPNRTIKSPPSLKHRYIEEDVGMGIVPWAALGDLAGVETPTMDALTHLASVINGTDYRREGLTLERMGLTTVSAERLAAFLADG